MLSDEEVLAVVAPVLDAAALEDPDDELDNELDDACSDDLAGDGVQGAGRAVLRGAAAKTLSSGAATRATPPVVGDNARPYCANSAAGVATFVATPSVS
jgi:hypothetical protein